MTNSTITKTQLIDGISQDAELNKKQSAAALQALVRYVVSALMVGNPVRVQGLGTFSVAERAARQGRNPQTGEAMEIPAKRVVKFKAEKGLV